METALYYTLSTVSQTLAGAMSLLAAFVVIRLSALDASITARVRYLYEFVGGDMTMLRESLKADGGKKMLAWYRDQFDKEVAAAAAEHPARGANWNSRTESHLAEGEAMQGTKERLVRHMVLALELTVAVIGFALLGLLLGPFLVSDSAAYWAVCGAAVTGAIATLALYVKLVRDVIA